MHKLLTIEMTDGSVWSVPIELIARDRATYYAHEYEDNVELSLSEDTIPLFESDPNEIIDWAENNMNWHDFDGHQTKISDGVVNFNEGWLNGKKFLMSF